MRLRNLAPVPVPGGRREIEILEEQRVDPQYAENGFAPGDFDGLISLYRRKREYLLSSMRGSDCWEWDAKLHYIVTGIKE